MSCGIVAEMEACTARIRLNPLHVVCTQLFSGELLQNRAFQAVTPGNITS